MLVDVVAQRGTQLGGRPGAGGRVFEVDPACQVEFKRPQLVDDVHLVGEGVDAAGIVEAANPVGGEHLVAQVAAQAQGDAERVAPLPVQDARQGGRLDLDDVQPQRLGQCRLQFRHEEHVDGRIERALGQGGTQAALAGDGRVEFDTAQGDERQQLGLGELPRGRRTPVGQRLLEEYRGCQRGGDVELEWWRLVGHRFNLRREGQGHLHTVPLKAAHEADAPVAGGDAAGVEAGAGDDVEDRVDAPRRVEGGNGRDNLELPAREAQRAPEHLCSPGQGRLGSSADQAYVHRQLGVTEVLVEAHPAGRFDAQPVELEAFQRLAVHALVDQP